MLRVVIPDAVAHSVEPENQKAMLITRYTDMMAIPFLCRVVTQQPEQHTYIDVCSPGRVVRATRMQCAHPISVMVDGDDGCDND